ncbi:MAG: DNA gyrase subunit A [Myxococcales bacterium]|nr:DNA gyrase subunit A [Myxococcales bacterium]
MADTENPTSSNADLDSVSAQALAANDTPEGPGAVPPASGSDGQPPRAIIPIAIEEEMKRSYLDYSMSVIIGRALPDVRDGLKPVHRRVLFAMDELGNHFNKAYKKSARIVGDVIGKYHPHGDQAVYDTLVRMAQDFSMRYLLVDGQGNFGSVDGDPPAAMRYTESRLTRLSQELLADLDKDTVDLGPNYDESLTEPLVLPTRFPNLLVNGSEGIAVGMATKIPPHNLGEVIDATIHLVDNPKASIADLMGFMPGPDFPTAGFICGRRGIYEAYTTGRGHLKVKARTEIEVDPKTDRETIVVTELPYQVNKARLIETIAHLHRDKVVEGISGLRDESDRRGMRIAIEVSRNAMAQVVLNNLFAHTDLQTTYGVILLAIDNGQPRVLNLRELLDRFISHRRDVVTRRTRFELRKAEARRHIVEGLLVAQDFIDHVISLIRASKDPEEANWGLQHILSDELYERDAFKHLDRIQPSNARERMAALVARLNADEPLCGELTHDYAGKGFSPEQAKAILEMRLQRLTGLEREALISELLDLVRAIAWYREILGDEATLLGVIKSELIEVRDRYSDPRRTQIVDEENELSIEDLIAEEDMVVTLSHEGYVKRNPVSDYRAQRRGGRGKTGASTKEDDFVEQVFVASTHAHLLIFSTMGRLYWLKVHAIPAAGRTSRGKAIVNMVQFRPDEKLAAVLPVSGFEPDRYVAFVTKKGVVKRTDLAQFSRPRASGINALGIDEDDALVAALLTDGTKDLLLSTRTGMAIRFQETDVRVMGRTAFGVRGIALEDGDAVVGAEALEDGQTILTITEKGYGKRTNEDLYRTQNRGGKGLIDIKTTERNGEVAGVLQVKDSDEIVLITNRGMLIRTRVNEISTIGRNTQGVRIISLGGDEKVSSIAKLPEESGEGSTPPPLLDGEEQAETPSSEGIDIEGEGSENLSPTEAELDASPDEDSDPQT